MFFAARTHGNNVQTTMRCGCSASRRRRRLIRLGHSEMRSHKKFSSLCSVCCSSKPTMGLFAICSCLDWNIGSGALRVLYVRRGMKLNIGSDNEPIIRLCHGCGQSSFQLSVAFLSRWMNFWIMCLLIGYKMESSASVIERTYTHKHTAFYSLFISVFNFDST